MPPALEPGANFVFPNLMLGSTETLQSWLIINPAFSIFTKQLLEKGGKFSYILVLYFCIILLIIWCAPPSTVKWTFISFITMLVWYFSIHWNEWMTAQGTAASRPRQAPQNKLTLVSHWISFSFLSRASALCLSSSLCLASVAASMSLIFKLKVTSFQRLKKSESAEYLVERGISNLKMKG